MDQDSIHMPAETLKAILESGAEDYILLDVRTPEEHQEENIGGKNIPVNILANTLDDIDLSKKIITYCKSGGRSTRACEILKQAGATEVYSLIGGITDYK